MIRLMSDCLLRVSEVAAVKCGDLKDNTLKIRQSKTDQLGEDRVLFVGDETWQVIDEYKQICKYHKRGAVPPGVEGR